MLFARMMVLVVNPADNPVLAVSDCVCTTRLGGVDCSWRRLRHGNVQIELREAKLKAAIELVLSFRSIAAPSHRKKVQIRKRVSRPSPVPQARRSASARFLNGAHIHGNRERGEFP